MNSLIPESRNAILAIETDPILNRSEASLTITAEIIRLKILAEIAYYKGENKNALNNYVKIISIFDSHIEIRNVQFKEYNFARLRAANYYLVLDRAENADAILSDFQKSEIKLLTKTPILFGQYLTLSLGSKIAKKDLNGIEKIAESAKSYLTGEKGNSPEFISCVFFYVLSYTYFSFGMPAKALFWMKEFRKKSNEKAFKSLSVWARILSYFIDFELGDLYSIKRGLPTLSKNLVSNSDESKYQRILIRILEKLTAKPDEEISTLLSKEMEELEQFKSLKEFENAFNKLDALKWIYAKLKGVKMAEL